MGLQEFRGIAVGGIACNTARAINRVGQLCRPGRSPIIAREALGVSFKLRHWARGDHNGQPNAE